MQLPRHVYGTSLQLYCLNVCSCKRTHCDRHKTLQLVAAPLDVPVDDGISSCAYEERQVQHKARCNVTQVVRLLRHG